MSVLIKGINMPKACEWCSFMSTFTTERGMGCRCEVEKFEFWDYTKRQKNCPLVEIPTSHGRLIDVDKFMDELQDISAKCMFDREKYIVSLIVEELTKAPTIIEAEAKNEYN